MSKPEHGGPAFPFEGGSNNHIQPSTGMHLRDYFAAKALPQAVNDYEGRTSRNPGRKGEALLAYECAAIGREDIIARQAYRMADAMLKAREGK